MQTNHGKVLVVGATGTLGREVLRALCDQRASVNALVRNAKAAKHLTHIEIVQGDLRDRDSVRAALRGVQSAFYASPHESDEEELGQQFIAECEAAQVRLVYVGVHVPGPNRFVRALRRWLFGMTFSHYRPKFRISERARVSKTNPVVLMPTNFFQNDELFRAQIAEGVFSQPFRRPINRVDVRDVACAAARACLDLTLPSGAYPVVGPESLDAADCARTWSLALQRQVSPAGPDDDAFERTLERQVTAPKKLSDFRASYALFAKLNLPTSARDLAQTTALLGRPPTSYAAYVGELVTGMRAAKVA